MFDQLHTRRQFLTRSALIAAAPSVPLFLKQTAQAADSSKDTDRILVVIQLSGGNDGINTLVPYTDEGYVKHRDQLRIPTQQLIRINDQLGLHPAMRPAADLLDDGRLALVQGVGYPNPNRSHEVSMAIWQSGSCEPADHTSFGWLGRALDKDVRKATIKPHSFLLGDENPPLALRGRKSTSVALEYLSDLQLRPGAAGLDNALPNADNDLLAFTRRAMLSARATADVLDDVAKKTAPGQGLAYPATQLAGRLQSIAQLIKMELPTPVYYTIQSGYDTHAVQLPTQARLLGELAAGMKAFLDDLKQARLDDRVTMLCFSEFGRRVKENASLGTDHGTAGLVFVAGGNINAGLVGRPPALTDLVDDDLEVQIDFRQIYASLLRDWLGMDAAAVLGDSYEGLQLTK